MTFTVAITTYNRPHNLAKLVSQITTCSLVPDEIIVVDSSDKVNEWMQSSNQVKYIRSSHKNQPYQRYLGYLRCSTEVIIFLDDDLEIVDLNVFAVMLERIQRPGIQGVSVGFQHHHAISEMIDSKIDGKSLAFRIINFISGVPVLKPGKIYMAGLAGPRPTEEAAVDYFNGAIMGFHKSVLAGLYNPVLFSLFERKLGMGEDKVISMAVGLTSTLWYVPTHFFVHPPTASNYFHDLKSFQRKVMYSRLYVSLQYGKLKHYPRVVILLHYYYFGFWRLLIAAMRALIKPGKKRYEALSGILQGVLLTFTLPFLARKISPEIDWEKDASKDAGIS